MEELLNTAPCGFLRFNDQGEILMVNSTLLAILGFDDDQLVGDRIDRILPVESRIFHQTHFFPLLKLHKKVDEVYFSLKSRNGEKIPMLVNAVRRDSVAHAVNDCVLIQMRQRSEYEDEILKAKHAAEQAVQAKDDFLATVSHELRTPLSAIKGWGKLLTRGSLNETDTARALDAIERSSDALQKLIEDLLDFSRIISGKLRLSVERVDVSAVVDSALDVVRPAADAKEIQLEAVISPDAPAVSGDPSRLQQVLWNLLSNAIKFSPKAGRVQIRVRRVDSSLEIAVADSGEGISADLLPYVFDRFRQSDKSPQRKAGLGLGLAISRHIVELHGGTIRAESEGPGLGATLTVRLPVMTIRESSTPDNALPRIAGRPSELAGLDDVHVVLAEDDAEAKRMLTTVLEHSGARVTACTTVKEALRKVKELRPHILLSDIELPDADGYFLIRSIRSLSDADLSKLPAIALTAHSGAEDRVRALAAGFQMHVAKPVEPIELVLAIANLTDRRHEQVLDGEK